MISHADKSGAVSGLLYSPILQCSSVPTSLSPVVSVRLKAMVCVVGM